MTNEDLVSQIREGENVQEYMGELYCQNKGLIAQEARKYPGEFDDLMQEGYFALYEAVMHFDADQGATFSTYCTFWIRQAMQRYINNNGMVRLSSGAGDMVRRYNRICRDYLREYGSEPSEDVLCELLGVDEDKLHVIMQEALLGQMRSLEEPVGEDGASVGDLLTSDEAMDDEVIKRLDSEDMKSELWKAVDNLPDNLPDALHQRYEDGKTLDQIAKAQEKSISGIRKDIHKGEKLLRNSNRSKGFIGYYQEYMNIYSHHVGVEEFQRTWVSEVEKIAFEELDSQS